jgi:hypothetical protein
MMSAFPEPVVSSETHSCALCHFAGHAQLAARALFANDVAVTSLCAM